MEVGESVLDSIDEELSFEDVEMMDIEEGEVVDGHLSEKTPHINCKEVESNSECVNTQPSNIKSNKKNKKRKKKKKNKKVIPRSDGVDIDRFVLSVCKRLRERKSYLVYSAVGVLGIPAMKDLVEEVDRSASCWTNKLPQFAHGLVDLLYNSIYAVQACGGQKTALGDRFRSGGGILWNILRARDPNAFKEIMKKGKDFEKQFKQPLSIARPHVASSAITNKQTVSTSDDLGLEPPAKELSAQPIIKENRGSVHDRIRVPVSYDDLPGEERPKDPSA